MNETDVYRVIKQRHAPPEWACFPGVRSQTGYAKNRKRTADAVAMSLYPSRGLEVHGFEIKVSRSDWLRELKQPEKAEEIAAFCDRWWIVAPPGVVQMEELPKTWGLYEVKGDSIRAKVKAPVNEAKLLDRSFFASLMRRASDGIDSLMKETIHRDSIGEELENARLRGFAEGKNKAGSELMHLNALREDVAAFEKKTGLRIQDVKYYNNFREIFTLATSICRAEYNLNSFAEQTVTTVERVLDELRQLKDGHKK